MVAHILHPPSPATSAVPLHPPTHTLGQESHVPVTMLLYCELLMHVLTGGKRKSQTDYYKKCTYKKIDIGSCVSGTVKLCIVIHRPAFFLLAHYDFAQSVYQNWGIHTTIITYHKKLQLKQNYNFKL